MSTIVATTGARAKVGPVALTRTAMTASDTLTYTPGGAQVLYLYNTTASIVTITLVGTAPVGVFVPGTATTVSTSSGDTVAVPASGAMHVALDDISAYLAGSGVVTITNGTGLTAMLVNS